MKIKVGDKVYDGEVEPVMVVFSKGERKQIEDMHPNATKYCVYPNTDEWIKDDYKKIRGWMQIP